LEKEYPRFATFYQRIIEPAVKEINESTDLNVYEVEKIKNGKRVDAVRFRFRQRVVTALLDPLSSNAIQPDIEKPKKHNTTIEISDNTQTYDDNRFTHFYPRVVENMGITPTVFIELLKNFTDEQFEQAIRVTNRAKTEGQIKTNVAGFFVQALKNGYTDLKEERNKKVKREESDNKTAQQIASLEYEKEGKIFDRIKQLTADNPRLTFEAIDIVKNSEAGKKAIKAEEKRLNRKLDVEDYRQNKELRALVIDALFQKNMEKFIDIIREYDGKVNALKPSNVF
jgi:hypothetical protein